MDRTGWNRSEPIIIGERVGAQFIDYSEHPFYRMVQSYQQPLRHPYFYDTRIGGSAGADTHGEQTNKPDAHVDQADCDYVVTNFDELASATDDAGATTFVSEDIDFTDKPSIVLAPGSTIVSEYCDPAVDGEGPIMHYDEIPRGNSEPHEMLESADGDPFTLVGVNMHGPIDSFTDHDYTVDDFEGQLVTAMWDRRPKEDGQSRFIGSRFHGFTWAGVMTGTPDNRTESKAYRCTFDNNNFNHYGYGFAQQHGDVWIDLSFFDNNRHHVAGRGWANELMDVTRSVGGPGPGASHAWDRHETIIDGTQVAGTLQMRNVTCMRTTSIWGVPQESVKIRGIPEYTSWFGKCHFWWENPPSETNPDQVQVIRQETDEWRNVDIRENQYGKDEWVEGCGAPLEVVPSQRLEQPTRTIAVNPVEHSGNYWIYVDGPANPATKAEGGDVVETQGDGSGNVCYGHVNPGWIDSFELGAGTNLRGIWSTMPLTLDIDGEQCDYLASLYAQEATRQ